MKRYARPSSAEGGLYQVLWRNRLQAKTNKFPNISYDFYKDEWGVEQYDIRMFTNDITMFTNHIGLFINDIRIFTNDMRLFTNDIRLSYNDIRLLQYGSTLKESGIGL